MNKKRWLSLVLVVAFSTINIFNLYMMYSFEVLPISITGKANHNGAISLIINAAGANFTIHSPNGTYNFNLSDRDSALDEVPAYFLIDLNVSTQNNITLWTYNLSVGGSTYVNNLTFTPNTTVSVRSGLNNIIVTAVGSGGTFILNNTFLVNVSSSAPIINLSEGQRLYACEDEVFSTSFNITDYDNNLGYLSITLDSSNPFYVGGITRHSAGIFTSSLNSFGFPLEFNDRGFHNRTITVDDTVYADSKNVSVYVIDVNMVPDVENIGVKQIYQSGNNSNFYKQWSVNDTNEDGTEEDQNMTFNISYQNGTAFSLFTINATGVMNFTSDENTSATTHNLRICATDRAVADPYENITTHCVNNATNNTVCDDFSLTISDSNRAPNITLSYLENTTFTTAGEVVNIYNVTFEDEDVNPLEVYWYVEDVLVNQSNYSFDPDYTYESELVYAFPCGVSGNQTVSVNVSDGALYDNFTWTVYVNLVECESGDGGGGGGGGGGGDDPIYCSERWVCEDWDVCLNVRSAFSDGAIFLDSYNRYLDQCRQLKLDDNQCGYQTRRCVDLSFCNNSIIRIPLEEPRDQVCEYVSDPRCNDNVKNCHSGSCEVLVDCGGPCNACPTCNDGIKNQHEEGIDCGGPCSFPCQFEKPESAISRFLVIIILQILLVVIFIIYLVYRILRSYYGKDRGDDKKDSRVERVTGKSRKERIRSLLNKRTKKR